MFVTPYSEYLKKHHSKSLNFFIQYHALNYAAVRQIHYSIKSYRSVRHVRTSKEAELMDGSILLRS